MIHLKNIYKQYSGHEVLHNVSLNITKADIIGIIGQSGAGKSTLLRSINLLERPDQGEVWINQQNLCQLSEKELRQARQQIGMIFQNYQLLSQQTVFDNIALPLKLQKQSKTNIEQRVSELLDLVGLSHKKTAYPSELSGGQKQRVAIARALSYHPSILLCDEATAALDPQTTQAILDLLVDIQKKLGITLVLITHDMQVAKKICHRLVLMEHGRIIEQGEWPTILQDKDSRIRQSLYGHVDACLPDYIREQLQSTSAKHAILQILFPGQEATVPFISEMSRELSLDINILSAQIDHSHQQQCGMMILGLDANASVLHQFLQQCQQHHIIGEVIGYVEHIRQ